MLNSDLERQLARIEPSVRDRGVLLYPCSVECKNGTILRCVYMVTEADFLHLTGSTRPRDTPWIPSEDIASMQESPMRLPPQFANELYQAGESGMGYRVFTVVFSWWCRQEYAQAFVDFIEYPPGKGPSYVRAVLPHVGGRRRPKPQPVIYWCLVSKTGAGPR